MTKKANKSSVRFDLEVIADAKTVVRFVLTIGFLTFLIVLTIAGAPEKAADLLPFVP